MAGLEEHADYVWPFVCASPGCNPAMSMIRDVLMCLNFEYEILDEQKTGDRVRMIASNAADSYRTLCHGLAITSHDTSLAAPCCPVAGFLQLTYNIADR